MIVYIFFMFYHIDCYINLILIRGNLKFKIIRFTSSSHLKSGTGYPCDWHNKTIGMLTRFFNPVLEKSDDNVGAL